jgi:hypothetical protein
VHDAREGLQRSRVSVLALLLNSVVVTNVSEMLEDETQTPPYCIYMNGALDATDTTSSPLPSSA